MIRVIMADDHPLVREGLKSLLASCDDIELTKDVDNGNDLITEIRANSYDVVLMDMSMPGRNGLELIKLIKNESPNLSVLVLSSHKEDLYAIRTIKAGASGYLCKDYAAANLIDALRKVAKGGKYISSSVAELMVQSMQAPVQDVEPHTLLSDREYQVFLLVANGHNPTEIANQLNLSIKTVSTHRSRIKDKTQLANDSQIIHYAIKHGLIENNIN